MAVLCGLFLLSVEGAAKAGRPLLIQAQAEGAGRHGNKLDLHTHTHTHTHTSHTHTLQRSCRPTRGQPHLEVALPLRCVH